MPVYFTPGVVHLNTVPSYRKWNKFDMGTADKVCCVALGIKVPRVKTTVALIEFQKSGDLRR